LAVIVFSKTTALNTLPGNLSYSNQIAPADEERPEQFDSQPAKYAYGLV
jgi:hypothetical protein